MELLRFTTAGHVDDGKSTLIGRLLYDSKAILEDQYQAIQRSSQRKGLDHVDLSLLTDGLKAEREQGITIDVAYRYFHTPKRKFIIADCPGHLQYTRNMVTGASNANVALILIDARQGIQEQTRRHSFIASLLQIPHLVICINKMDLVDYQEDVYEEIKAEFTEFARKLMVKDIQFIPISALKGDNVVERSAQMPWYEGNTLMYYLENVHIASDHNYVDCRFPVQYVIRPQQDAFHDYRGYAGRVAGGIFKKGDRVMVLPSGLSSTITQIELAGEQLEQAYPPMSVTLLLADDLDISRGDMIVREHNAPQPKQDLELMLCWFDHKPLQLGGKYSLIHTSKQTRCVIKEIRYKLDINTLHRNLEDQHIGLNDIARIVLRSTSPLLVDPYAKNKTTGSLILVEEGSGQTVAAGMILT
jgi:sulfate adenylyltransferase subunit 1